MSTAAQSTVLTPAQIRSARWGKQLDVAQAAARVGVDRRTWYAWEAGKQHPSPAAHRRLALEFGLPAVHIFLPGTLAIPDQEWDDRPCWACMLHHLRVTRGLSLGTLARHTGLTVPALRQLEHHDRRPAVRTRLVLSSVFGLDDPVLRKTFMLADVQL